MWQPSFHLPSVSTANINTVQCPKPYKQSEMPTIPALVMSVVLLPQSNIMAAFAHSHSNLLFDASSGLPTYSDHNVTQFTGLFSTVISCWTFRTLPKMSNCQHTTVYLVPLTLNSLTWKIWWAPNNASKRQMGFNSAFKWLMSTEQITCICQILGKN